MKSFLLVRNRNDEIKTINLECYEVFSKLVTKYNKKDMIL